MVVELLAITGGSTLLQALVGRSIHSANVTASAGAGNRFEWRLADHHNASQ